MENFIQKIPIHYQCIIIFLVQLGFIFFRTRDIIFTSRKMKWQSILNGLAVHVMFLLSVSMGVNSVLNLKSNFVVLIFSALGGATGTYFAIKNK